MELKNVTKVQWIMGGVMIVLCLLFIFREQVFETKIAKAKMKIFETMIQDPPDEAKENIKNILDTLVNH